MKLIFSSLLLLWSLLTVDFLESKKTTEKLQCLDDSGHPVDWFIVYKFPYLKSLQQPDLFGGYHYAYITSKTQHDGWHFSHYNVTDSKSIFGRTLAPYFSAQRSHLTSMFYNDQPPTHHDVPSSYAHAKGLIMADEHQGFWLIHTVPKFVAADAEKYSYVSTGGRYGQVALCISLSVEELTKVVHENFLVARPYVYSMFIEKNAERSELGKALTNLEHHKWNKHINFTELHLTSLSGQQFRSFYKNPNYEVDLYAGVVAKQMKTSLRVETWRHPPGGPLDSDCTLKQAEVENIERIQLKFVDSDLEGQFSSYDDHSKWAISRDHQHDLVCIGDMNRVHSQFHRGGGTTCITEASVWSNFNSLINKVDKCPDDKSTSLGPSKKKSNRNKRPGFWSDIFEKIEEYLKQ